MQATNLNIFSILIFIIILLIIAFLAYQKYYSQINFNKEFKLLSSNKKFYIKYIFLFLSIFIILFGIFSIKYSGEQQGGKVSGIDMMFVLDVSKSMNVADVVDSNYAYTRLDIAKKAIGDYVVKNSENRYGLVIFAGDAISTIPLTTDSNLFLTMLSGVDYRNLTVQGSDFKKALNLATNRFIGNDDRSKALVFISDGGDKGDNINISPLLTKEGQGVVYAVIGIGTEKGGKIVLGQDQFGRIKYQRYRGEYVISKLNLDNLEKIANTLNTDVIELKKVGDLKKISSKFKDLKKKAYTKNITQNMLDASRILTIFSFILFMIFLGIYINPHLASPKGEGLKVN